MSELFEGKRALVTGAGQGIGRDIAMALSKSDAEVVAVSRSSEPLESLKSEIACRAIQADLGDPEAARGAAEEAGPIDMLVNNAGISIPQSFLDTTVEAFDETLAVNVRAVAIVSQIVTRGMIDRGAGGTIVNVSSQASTIALADHTAYCASKGALDQLTRVMALELGPHNIRVNAVNPTITMTPMGEMAWADPDKRNAALARIPLGKFAQPADITRAVMYLLSEQSDMIHGATLPIDGGFLIT